MATIKEQAAAINGYAADIDAAIVAKGGTTVGGLRYASAAIEALPSGGAPANALPIGCPRVDLVNISTDIDEFYGVVFTDEDTCAVSGICDNLMDGAGSTSFAQEVSISNDGSVEPIGSVVQGRPFSLSMSGRGYHAFRVWDESKTGFYNGEFSPYRTLTSCIPIAEKGAFVSGSDSYYKCAEGGICKTVQNLRKSGIDRVVIFNKNINYIRAFLYSDIIYYAKIKGTASGNSLEALFRNQIGGIYYADFSELDMSQATSASGSNGNPGLIYLRFPPIEKGIRVSISLSSSSKLSHDSLMSVINSLYDHVAAGTGSTPTLTLGSTNLAKLTAEEKAIATDKGWILA